VVNPFQKAARWMMEKAVGFPPWRTDNWPSAANGILGLGGYSNSSGTSIGGLNALQVSGIWACARLFCQTMGSLPLHLIQDTGKGKIKAIDNPLFTLLHDSPNQYMTSMEWREAMALGYILFGNSFSKIERIGNRIVALTLMRPDWMLIRVNKQGELEYEYRPGSATPEVYKPSDILHFRNFSIDGIVGLSPVEQQRHVIGLAAAQQDQAGAIVRNGGAVSGTLEHPSHLKPEIAQKIRDSWDAIHSGASNAGKVAVLWEGMKYNRLGLTMLDQQFLEQRKFQLSEIARIYGFPPHKIGDLDRATFSNIEHQGIEFVVDSILPHCIRWEQRMNKTLLFGAMASNTYFKFNVDGLLRGDAAARASFYSTMVQNGIFTRNECRENEDRDRSDQPGSDELTVQVNLIDLANLSKLVPATPAGGTQ
jgi:HK97 family phage portal protein